MLPRKCRASRATKAELSTGLRRLQTELDPRRTPQAVEFKHANISAVMIGLGLPYIRGYKPYGNYQAALKDEVRRRLEDPQLLAALRLPGQARQRQVCGGPGRRRRPGNQAAGRLTDGLLQEENSRRGRLGEQLVVAFE